MLDDLKSALEEWPTDTPEEDLSLSKELEPLLVGLAAKADDILEYAPKLASETADFDGLFDKAYSDSHYITGFGRIITSNKIVHLGMLSELITESGRQLQTYSDHSMLYLLDLLIKKLTLILSDFLSNQSTDIDIADVVNECAIYLTQPVSELLERDQKKRQGLLLNIEISQSETVSTKKSTSKKPVFSQLIYEDNEEDEILNIPIDKVGLISDFCEEAWDSLQTSENLLVELENNPNSKELINELFRAVHTVKGGARLIEVKKIELLSHELETVLDSVRNDSLSLNASLIDLALNCIKRIEKITHEVAERGPVKTQVNDLIFKLKTNPVGEEESNTTDQLLQIEPTFDTKPSSAAKATTSSNTSTAKHVIREDSIKVSAEKLDSVLNTSSEVYISRIKLENDQRLLTEALNKLNNNIFSLGKELDNLKLCDGLEVEKSRDVNVEAKSSGTKLGKIDSIQEISTNLNDLHNDFVVNMERLSIHNRDVQKNIEDLEVLSARLQSGAMNFRMLPIANLFNRFPAQVRDIARQIGKRVDLKITGSDTELDKILISQLADPLLHLIRNSIDHGIENPEMRRARNKSEIGEIQLRAFYMGSNAIIEIEDDGNGIDPQKILSKAVDKGLVSKTESSDLSEKEIFDFIFEPGFSSAEKVTELSGRGVGMDVVKTSINRMQGSIKIDSALNSGTKVVLRLPLTLAVVGILLVAENGYEFAFPILNVEEIKNIRLTKDIMNINNTLVYNFRGDLVPVNFLSDFLNFPKNKQSNGEKFLLILNDGESKLGILVDEVRGQQNVLLKKLGSLIEKAPFVIGCTILSNSKLVLILNVLELTSASSEVDTTTFYEKVETVDTLRDQRRNHSIMVVDDSSMQRKRICEFLQSNGYKTEEAADGYVALDICENIAINAFCVDIQMPLMDGYELIERLRKLDGHKKTNICVISGVHMNKENTLSRLNDMDVFDFYEKPVDLDNLIANLDEKLIGLEAGPSEGALK